MYLADSAAARHNGPVTTPDPPRPRHRWPAVACVTPLWFVWHRRWVEVTLVWLVLFAEAWETIGRAEGWVRSDALRIATMGLVATIAAVMPSPTTGPSPTAAVAMALVVLQGWWAFRLARRDAVAPVNRWSATATAALMALGAWGFSGLHVPGTKPRAYVAAMRHDLQRLSAGQDSVFAARHAYARALNEVPFERSTGVVLVLEAAGDSGWSAHATHNGTRASCSAFGGRSAPPIPGAVPHEPACVLPVRAIPWNHTIPPMNH